MLNPNYYSQGLFKKNLQSAQSAVCILTWLHFSMVYYSVNKAINDKKSIIAIQNSSGIHVHTSSTVSPFQAAIMTFQISPLKMNNKFQGFHPVVWTSFNEIKNPFSRPIQMFISTNSKWTALQDKISFRIFDPSLNNKTTVLMMQTTQKVSFLK